MLILFTVRYLLLYEHLSERLCGTSWPNGSKREQSGHIQTRRDDSRCRGTALVYMGALCLSQEDGLRDAERRWIDSGTIVYFIVLRHTTSIAWALWMGYRIDFQECGQDYDL